MTADYTQAAFPYAGLLGLILAVLCLGYVLYSVVRLVQARRTGQAVSKRWFQIAWNILVTFFSLLLLLVSVNSVSTHFRLRNALQTGAFESWSGVITDITVEDKGTDFDRNPVYKIVITLDDTRQFTCCWLTPEQILLLQKKTPITIGCASQVGSVVTRDALTIYQSPDTRGNVVRLEVPSK